MSLENKRERRIIFNDDSQQQFVNTGGYTYDIHDERTFIDTRTAPTFDTLVDTYVWCVGNGVDPPWGEWGNKRRDTIRRFLGSSDRASDLIIEACHANGMEIWGSLRINDLHDARAESLKQTNDPLKFQHPEYLLGIPNHRNMGQELLESHLWSAFNFEHPEVRQYRLEYIGKNAAAHDFDGYELDFTRFIWNLPLGSERALAPLMTDFIREVRLSLNTIASRRGRPYTFAVHVMDSVESSLELGQDVETWLDEDLIDVLVVGMGFSPFALRLGHWRTLADRFGVPIYPSLNTRPLFRLYKNRLKRASAWQEYIRAAASVWWNSGADGIYLFNLFTHEDEDVGRIDRNTIFAPLSEVGSVTQLTGKDKLYGIDSIRNNFAQGSEATDLPIPLDIFERKLQLNMGPDANDAKAQFKIHAWTSGGEPETKVWMRLNHALLEPMWQDDHYTVEIPSGLMRVGSNELALCCDIELSKTISPLIVHEVLTSVTY